ncbi:MAG: hypothetical protein RBT38_11095 [Bacteroidales bacterium]|jgi:hypothetical protein|nr:hypothetical protein [Bacteroidales bacterium]
MQRLFVVFAFLLLISSCIKEPDPVIIDIKRSYLAGVGFFITNEGNFRTGNGSLSFFSYDSMKVFNNVFKEVNHRPLGDIPYSMVFKGDLAYIVVNNSGKIEVVKGSDIKSAGVINGLNSPRCFSPVDDSKAYVSSLYSDSVAVIDLSANTISGYIDIKKTSEAIVNNGTSSYIASWVGGNKIMVVDNATDIVTDSIEVGFEPESMVIDRNGTLWVLCNGGWQREHFAELISINTLRNEIEKRFVFPSLNDSPSCLQIDGRGEVLYFLMNGVRKMPVESSALPSSAFIAESQHAFYKLGINPRNNDIIVTDAGDFSGRGILLRFSSAGELKSEFLCGIIPGAVCFRDIPGHVTE